MTECNNDDTTQAAAICKNRLYLGTGGKSQFMKAKVTSLVSLVLRYNPTVLTIAQRLYQSLPIEPILRP
jgi:hypothetical protein